MTGRLVAAYGRGIFLPVFDGQKLGCSSDAENGGYDE